jgi:hypothetical protein
MRFNSGAAVAVVIIIATASVVVGWILLRTAPTSLEGAPTGPCPNCPALGFAGEWSHGSVNLYNFTIQSGSTVTWNMVSLSVQSSSGANISTSGPGWNISVRGGSGVLVAAYDIRSASPVWTVGGSANPVAGQTIVLTSPLSQSLGGSGDSLAIYFGDGFRSTTVVAIP